MSRTWSRAGGLLALVLLAGCAAAPVRQAPEVVSADQAQARQQARQARLQALPDWSMQGRVALSVGDRGGSGRLDWRQQGDASRPFFSEPVHGKAA